MNGTNWKRRLHQLMETVERESTTALREINGCLEALGQPFDEKFRQHYLEMSNIRLNTSFDTVRAERRFDNEMEPHSSASIRGNGMANNANLLYSTQDHFGSFNATVNELEIVNNVPIEISDSDDEDNGIQQVPAVNDSTPNTNRGDANLEHQQFDLVRAASSEPNSNRKSEMVGVEREAAIAAPIADRCSSKNLLLNSQKHPNPGSNGVFKCEVCEYSTQNSVNLNRHQLKHTATGKPFKCEHCDYATRVKFSLKRHQRMHEQQQLMGIVPDPKNGSFKCTLCDQKFTKWYAFTKHFTQSHKNNQRLFNCAKCLRRFTQKGKKERHEARCENHRYECHLCKTYVTSSKVHMQEHMLTHSGAKPFECLICNRKFSLKSSLRSHLNSVHNHNKL